MKKFYKLFIISIGAFLLFSSVTAKTLIIKGHVLTDSGKAVPNHIVSIMSDSIYSSNFIYFKIVSTDNDGFYSDTLEMPATNFSKLVFNVYTYDCKMQFIQKTLYYNYNNDDVLIADFTICSSIVLPPLSCQAYLSYYQDSTGLVYDFNDESIGNNITNWLWDFGDNTTSTDENPVHQFSQAGTYNVCLTISSIGGNGGVCSDKYCQEISIGNNPPPPSNCKAYFDSYQDTTSNGLTYNFYDESSFAIVPNLDNMRSWLWDFGDGTTSTDENPVHQYAQAGEYNVCLTISTIARDTACKICPNFVMLVCSDTYCQDIYVGNNPPPTYNCQAYFDYYADSTGLVYDFNDGSEGDNITSWLWDFGDNTTSTDENPVHQFTQAGEYNVCLTISSTAGDSVLCSDTYCQDIFVGNNPPPTYNCQSYFDYYADSTGLVYNFNDGSEGDNITSWLWDFGDNTTSTDENPVHQFTQAGEYNVCLTISSTAGDSVLCSDTYCQDIYVGNNPPPTYNCQSYFDY